jgi:phage terminase large subunit-like protein
MAMLTMRLGQHPRVCITTTPKPSKLLKNLIERDGRDVIATRGSTYESVMVARGLWTLDMLEAARVTKSDIPDFRRVVIAVDQARRGLLAVSSRFPHNARTRA